MSIRPTPTRHAEQRTPSELQLPLAVDAKRLAAMLGLSTRTIRTMDAAGKLPRPVTLACRSVRWRVDEIRDWLNDGCPDRSTWEVLKKNGKPAR